RAGADRPRPQPDRSPALAAARPPRCAKFEGADHHRTDGGEPLRTAVADRDRRQCRPVAPPDRAAVPPGDGPLARPLLSGDQARPRPPSADPVVDAGGRGGRRLRLRLGLAFLEMLPRALRALAAAGA